MLILGIESSCDETGIALYDAEKGLIADALYSQIDLHKLYGGVVPELASRDHMQQLILLMDKVLAESATTLADIDGIAYTAGPGLVGALLVGASFAKSLAYALKKPALAIHHLEAHILAALLEHPQLTFPFLALLVSGGHTQLIEAKALGDYAILGESVDDAVGEAFDKTAKLMGIAYPGGAKLAHFADMADETLKALFPPFPRPMLHSPDFNFSFSGLKTHALMAWSNSAKEDKALSGIAYAFQKAVVETLTFKCKKALTHTKAKSLVMAGGVGANKALRASISALAQTLQIDAFFPHPKFCTDNGAMVAFAGFKHFQQGAADEGLAIEVKARWPL